MDTENILIEKAKAGDEESFSKLIDHYKNYVFAIILNFIKDHNEVENVAQEVFLQIYVSLPKYDQINFKGWIGRITTNKSIDWIRKRKAKFNEESIEDGFIEIVEIDQRNNPEILLVEQEKQKEVIKVLNSIPEIYRITIEKFYFQEKSYEVIAKEEEVESVTNIIPDDFTLKVINNISKTKVKRFEPKQIKKVFNIQFGYYAAVASVTIVLTLGGFYTNLVDAVPKLTASIQITEERPNLIANFSDRIINTTSSFLFNIENIDRNKEEK